MSFVLLDTDILINLLRGIEGAKVFVQNAAVQGLVGCSAITVAEIYAGMRAHEREKTESLLDGLEIIDVTRAIAEKAGGYRAAIKSQDLELDDCLIAATAFETRATLATGNGKHYPMTDIHKDVVSLT